MRTRLLLALFAVFAALFVPPAKADAVMRDSDGDVLRIVDAPCPPEIATFAQQGMRGYYRAGTFTISGVVHPVCGSLVRVKGVQGVQVHVIGRKGGDAIFPYSDFVDEEPPGADPEKPTV